MAFAVPNPLQEMMSPTHGTQISLYSAEQERLPSHAPAASKAPATAQLKAQRRYQQAQIENASPARLVVMLYDGAIRFCNQGREAMLEKRLEDQNDALIKAQRIVLELMGALDQETGGEMASNLMRVYTHVLDRLIHANLQDDPATLENATTLLTELRESWAEVERVTSLPGGKS